MRDLYEVLGISNDVSQDEIKRAYRKLAMKYHPDKNPDNKEAEQKFKEAASAYEVLGNPNKRQQYDRFGSAAFSQGEGSYGGFQNMEDIFASFTDIFDEFFSDGKSSGSGRRGAYGEESSSTHLGRDLLYRQKLNLKEVLQGGEKCIDYTTEKDCSPCKGKGLEPGHEMETCLQCQGRGQVGTSHGIFSFRRTCNVCGGRGRIIRHPCKTCRGKGRMKKKQRVQVSIPPGVDTGIRLRIQGEGEGGYLGGQNGDLYVEVEVEKDNYFEREGQHLYCHIKVHYLDLLLGGEVEVPSLEGQRRLKVPQGTQVGELLCLKGDGLPQLQKKKRGNLFCRVEVEISARLGKQEKELLQKLSDLRFEKR